jgi:hypothetical protein
MSAPETTRSGTPVQFSCLGQPVEGPPRCPGVYRFYGANGSLLYIGKSIDIGTRFNSHRNGARDPGRQQRMMNSVVRVDCELTAGDFGAQFIENAAIKAEAPLYNRRQRRTSTLWTQRLVEGERGFLRVEASDFSPAGERSESVYGLFRSRTQMHRSLKTLAREEGLCLRVLGVERGRGPCFQSQIGRCRGACAGRETPAEHNQRLRAVLDEQRIAAWPFAGPVLLLERRREKLHATQPARQYHLLHHWCYLGSHLRRDQALRATARAHDLYFDRDCYHIAMRALRSGSCGLIEAESGADLDNPFYTEELLRLARTRGEAHGYPGGDHATEDSAEATKASPP